MKNLLFPLALLAAARIAAADGILPNPSFEKSVEDRPKGWRVFLTPEEVRGTFYVASGQEGKDTRTGAAALLFSFPDGADLAQGAWMADPAHGGGDASPGGYFCSFWIRAENLPEGFHAWVSIVGYDLEGKRIGEVARSEYLSGKNLTGDSWTQIRFSFDVAEESKITRLAPSVILKAQPSGDPASAPADLRVWVDDLQITKE